MEKISRRSLVLAAGMAIAALSQAQGPARQESYPNHSIRMVVPYTPGAGADLTARTVGQKLSEAFAQPVAPAHALTAFMPQ